MRCKQAGLPSPAAVYLVSSVKGTGVRDMMTDLQEKVGSRGDIWVVGAQNAGKSSLINAMQKVSGVSHKQQITAAALPGTTLGMLSCPQQITNLQLILSFRAGTSCLCLHCLMVFCDTTCSSDCSSGGKWH